jgi:hypothetical protein
MSGEVTTDKKSLSMPILRSTRRFQSGHSLMTHLSVQVFRYAVGLLSGVPQAQPARQPIRAINIAAAI